VHNPDPRTPPWGDRCPTGQGLGHGPLVAPAQHPRLLFHWKSTPARLGRKQESHEDLPDLRICPRSVPQHSSQEFSIFPDRIPVGFYTWPRCDLIPACARIVEAFTSFPVPPEGPNSGRRVSPSVLSGPSRGTRSGAHHPTPPWRDLFACGPWAPWTPASGRVSHATPLGGCYVDVRDPPPAHAGVRVTPDRGCPPQQSLSQ